MSYQSSSDGNDDVKRSLLNKRSSSSVNGSYTEPEHKHTPRSRTCTSSDLLTIRGRSPLYKIAQNASSGMTVALVNVPLSISLAVASGVSPSMGIVTAIWSGFIAAATGGSHFNIVGPTGALSGLLFRYSVIYGVEVMAILAFISTGLLAIVYALGLDTYVMFLPNAVNVGFTLGVAFIIGAGQIPNALGLTGLPVHHELIQNLGESIMHIGNFEWFAATVFFVSWFTLYNCGKRWPKIPWSILLSTVGIGLGYASTNGYIHHLNTLMTKYGNLRADLFLPVVWKDEYRTNFADLVSASSSVAFVAVLETLISGKIAETMTQVHMHSRREVFGVTMANLASACAGGMPATAALARTALNIRSGAYSRISGMLNGIFTAIFAVVVMPTFQYLPLPIVGAMVAQVAVNMVDTHELKQYWKLSKSTFYLTLGVAILCVVQDPTMGIVFGCVVGLFQNSERQSRGANVTTIGALKPQTRDDSNMVEDQEYSAQVGGDEPPPPDASFNEKLSYTMSSWFCDPEADDTEHHHAHDGASTAGTEVLCYSFSGSLSFVNVGQHIARVRRYLHQRRDVASVVLSLEATHYLDVDGLLGVQEMMKGIEQYGKNGVLVIGTRHDVVELTNKSEWIASLTKNRRVFTTNDAAIAWFRSLSGNSSSSVGIVIDSNGKGGRPANGTGHSNGNGTAPMYPTVSQQ